MTNKPKYTDMLEVDDFSTFKLRKRIQDKLDNDKKMTLLEDVQLALIDFPYTRDCDTWLYTTVCQMNGIGDFDTLNENPEVINISTMVNYARKTKKEYPELKFNN